MFWQAAPFWTRAPTGKSRLAKTLFSKLKILTLRPFGECAPPARDRKRCVSRAYTEFRAPHAQNSQIFCSVSHLVFSLPLAVYTLYFFYRLKYE